MSGFKNIFGFWNPYDTDPQSDEFEGDTTMSEGGMSDNDEKSNNGPQQSMPLRSSPPQPARHSGSHLVSPLQQPGRQQPGPRALMYDQQLGHPQTSFSTPQLRPNHIAQGPSRGQPPHFLQGSNDFLIPGEGTLQPHHGPHPNQYFTQPPVPGTGMNSAGRLPTDGQSGFVGIPQVPQGNPGVFSHPIGVSLHTTRPPITRPNIADIGNRNPVARTPQRPNQPSLQPNHGSAGADTGNDDDDDDDEEVTPGEPQHDEDGKLIFTYACQPDDWKPSGKPGKDYEIIVRRENVNTMTDRERQNVRQPDPANAHTADNIGEGLASGRGWMGFFDPARPNVPVLRCPLQTRRGRGAPSRGGATPYTGYPPAGDIIPAGLSLREICQRFPNHVWGDLLRIFKSEGWGGHEIYDAFDNDVKKQCSRTATATKDRPHNFLQAAMGREVDIMANEARKYRKVYKNIKKGRHPKRAPDDEEDADGRDNSQPAIKKARTSRGRSLADGRRRSLGAADVRTSQPQPADGGVYGNARDQPRRILHRGAYWLLDPDQTPPSQSPLPTAPSQPQTPMMPLPVTSLGPSSAPVGDTSIQQPDLVRTNQLFSNTIQGIGLTDQGRGVQPSSLASMAFGVGAGLAGGASNNTPFTGSAAQIGQNLNRGSFGGAGCDTTTLSRGTGAASITGTNAQTSGTALPDTISYSGNVLRAPEEVQPADQDVSDQDAPSEEDNQTVF